jgi:hypothetical protein
MEILKNIDQLTGETIKGIFTPYSDDVTLIFTKSGKVACIDMLENMNYCDELPLLTELDEINKMFNGLNRTDKEDLIEKGLISKSFFEVLYTEYEKEKVIELENRKIEQEKSDKETFLKLKNKYNW